MWRNPAALALLKGTAINYLLIEGAGLGPIASEAAKLGIAAGGVPPDVRLIEGDWPGVQSSHGSGHTSAGPTGVPWVDSNGWKVRLEAALHPGAPIWVDARPKERQASYSLAAADAASHGGQWIATLDDSLATAIAGNDPRALGRWNEFSVAIARLASHAWHNDPPRAVIGVVSDFTGPNEFLSHELLNLLARANQQYRILVKGPSPDFKGLRALLYADAAPPDPALRRAMLAFVEAGGLLIASPQWGPPAGAPAREPEHPRYDVRAAGKGRIAIARTEPGDPYILANDSVVLVSHRYDLLRFWNAGAVGSYLTASSDGSRTVAHLLFYADQGPRDASLRVAGRFRSAALWTLDRAEPRRLEPQPDQDGTELHLPPVNQYAAIGLEG